jgi:hypothetical protein
VGGFWCLAGGIVSTLDFVCLDCGEWFTVVDLKQADHVPDDAEAEKLSNAGCPECWGTLAPFWSTLPI